MEYIEYTINPQVIFLYNNNKKIQRTIFLAKDSMIEKTNVQDVYNYLLMNHAGIFLSTPEFINDHVILTFTLEQARGYIQNILNLSEPIILFSIWSNFDYAIKNSIFDPYNITNKLAVYANDDKNILYNLDINIVNGAVFCVTTNDRAGVFLAKPGVFKDTYRAYILEILKNIYKNKYKLRYEIRDPMEYSINIDFQDIIRLSNIDDYKKTLCISIYGIFYIKGDIISLLDNFDSNQESTFMVIKGDTFNISIFNEILLVNNLSYFTNILKDHNIISINIKSIKPKTTIYIYFDTFLNPNLTIEFDFDFFISETKKTKNIFVDLSNKINIMTSQSHISLRSHNITDNLSIYLTLIILGYSHIYNKVRAKVKTKKIDELYPSRYCQNYKDVKRQPILIDNFDESKYEKISDKFYKGKEDDTKTYKRKGTKKIFDPLKYGDIYIDENGLKYQCSSIYYSNMGFLNNIFSATNVCYPCCYSKPKQQDTIFNTCVHDTEFIQESNISPIIVNYGRLMLNPFSLSKLPDKLHKLINYNCEIKIVKHTNRIMKAKNCTVIMAYQPSTVIRDFNEMYDFVIKNNAIVINENVIYTHKKILDIVELPNVYILIQNRLHQFKDINKQYETDIISTENINKKKVNIIKSKFNILSNITKDLSENGITVRDDQCFVDDILIPRKNVKYFTKFSNILFKQKSVSEYIFKYFKQYIDTNIYTNNILLFTKIFVINILNMLQETDTILSDFTYINEKLERMTSDYITSRNSLR